MATSQTTPAQLQSLAQRVNAWRSTRRRGQRIPDQLWKAAANAARVHGVNRTATALKLNYYELQRRLWDHRLQGRARKWPAVPPPAFVELAPAASAGRVEQGAVELVNASGTRLTLRLGDIPARELLGLVEVFLRHGP